MPHEKIFFYPESSNKGLKNNHFTDEEKAQRNYAICPNFIAWLQS